MIKRRELLKTMATAGSLAVSASGLRLDAADPIDVKAVRGLVSKDGKLWQPITVSIGGREVKAATAKIGGVSYQQQPIAPGEQALEILVPADDNVREALVSVDMVSGVQSAPVTLKPVRKVVVYVLPHSHHDLGYTDLQANVEQKQMRNIDLGIELARKTANYPEGSRFVWNLEVLWGADLYMRRNSASKQAEFIEAVKKGWLALNGMYANELTGLCRPEELLQLFRYGTVLGAQCGVRVDSAMLSDVPGFTWGTATAMGQAGIRYFSAAPNWFDRIGSLMVEWQDKPFWWVSPSGKERVLVWIPWTGYAMSHVVKKTSVQWVSDYQDRLDQVQFPYSISYIRWSGHGDNAEPDPDISEFFKEWQQKYEWPKFRISSTSTAFSDFENRHGSALREYQGDLTPYWEDGAGSSALETALNRSAAERLVQVDALFASGRTAQFPNAQMSDAWRDVLLYSEHTWGAWNSVSDSEKPFVTDQWKVKREFAVNADQLAKSLLAEALPEAAGTSSRHVEIHNTCSWERSEVICLSRELTSAGDRAQAENGDPVPSQRLTSGELAVHATVKPFAIGRLNISAGASHPPAVPVTVHEGTLDNGLLQVRVDLKTGNIVDLRLHGVENNLAADAGGNEQVNQYLFLPGSNLADLQQSGAATVTVKEKGPLLASLQIESEAPGCNRLSRTVSLAAGADYVDIVNVVDKKQAALNPSPGKGGPGDAFAQSGNKESVQFAFPFAVKDGQMRVDVPLAVMRPGIDQLPGSCKNWLPVGRWIDVSNEEHGITWVTLDAPLVEIGEISANLLGSQRNPAIWRKHIAPTQKFYSWVMNNHWGTNYRAYQQGPVTFRYAIQAHGKPDFAAASKLAIGKSQPLLPQQGNGVKIPEQSFLTIEPNDVLVTCLKPADDGRGTIVRLFGASGSARQARLHWASSASRICWLSDLSESRLEQIPNSIAVGPWQLVTVRVDHS